MLAVVDVSYGGENGFSQAIELCAELLSNVKFIQARPPSFFCFEPFDFGAAVPTLSAKSLPLPPHSLPPLPTPHC